MIEDKMPGIFYGLGACGQSNRFRGAEILNVTLPDEHRMSPIVLLQARPRKRGFQTREQEEERA